MALEIDPLTRARVRPPMEARWLTAMDGAIILAAQARALSHGLPGEIVKGVGDALRFCPAMPI
jgi:hypothetical protein